MDHPDTPTEEPMVEIKMHFYPKRMGVPNYETIEDYFKDKKFSDDFIKFISGSGIADKVFKEFISSPEYRESLMTFMAEKAMTYRMQLDDLRDTYKMLFHEDLHF